MAILPPVPPIPEANRYQAFVIASPTSNFDVAFPIFGDGSDLLINLNGATVGPWNSGAAPEPWTLVSLSGVSFANPPLPITDDRSSSPRRSPPGLSRFSAPGIRGKASYRRRRR